MYRLIILFLFTISLAYGQNCPQGLATFRPSAQKGVLNWKQFPEFTLPFINIYGGARFNDTEMLPFKYGFTHLGFFNDTDFRLTKPSQRAMLWYNVAFRNDGGEKQPWELFESPWGNDLNFYKKKWQQEISTLNFAQQGGRIPPNVDLLVLDIERMKATDGGILSLKSIPQTPSAYKNLSDAAFLDRYKRDLQALYIKPIQTLREMQMHPNTKVSSYSDTPIRNTFINIDGNSWQDWQTNINRVNYVFRDTVSTNAVGGMDNHLDFLTPSAYFFYDITHPFGPNYLAYLLFQIEANRAWSKKDLIVFEWLTYHNCCGSYPNRIDPKMAEAGAIFPYFSGAKGIWLWDQGAFITQPETLDWSVYEHFVHGLYRLSQYKSFFEGNYQLYMPKSARNHFEDRDPVWRGVLKDGKLLVAAQNPYATETQTTNLPLSFGNWQTTITLKGREVFLCAFDLPVSDLTLANVQLFPNPNEGKFTLRFQHLKSNAIKAEIFNSLGMLVLNKEGVYPIGEFTENFDLSYLASGVYTLKLTEANGQVITKKMVIHQ